MLIGCSLYHRSIQQQRFSGLDGDELYPRLRSNFNRLAADHWYIKTKILAWFRYFDYDGHPFSERRTSPHRLIGPFKRFYCQNSPVADYNRLADIQSTDLLGNSKPVFSVV